MPKIESIEELEVQIQQHCNDYISLNHFFADIEPILSLQAIPFPKQPRTFFELKRALQPIFKQQHFPSAIHLKVKEISPESHLSEDLNHNLVTYAPSSIFNHPVYFISDLHGDWHHLKIILNKIHFFDPSVQSTLIVGGDNMGRGKYPLKVLIGLMLLKKEYPDRLYLLMGNHELDPDLLLPDFKMGQDFKEAMKSYDQIQKELFALSLSTQITSIVHKAFSIALILPNGVICSHSALGFDDESILETPSSFSPSTVPLEQCFQSIVNALWSDFFDTPYRGAGYTFNQWSLSQVLYRFRFAALLRGHSHMTIRTPKETADVPNASPIFTTVSTHQSSPDAGPMMIDPATFIQITESMICCYYLSSGDLNLSPIPAYLISQPGSASEGLFASVTEEKTEIGKENQGVKIKRSPTPDESTDEDTETESDEEPAAKKPAKSAESQRAIAFWQPPSNPDSASSTITEKPLPT